MERAKITLVDIGNRCRAFRESLGFSQGQVGYQLGYVDGSSISRFEAGQNDSLYIMSWYLKRGFKYNGTTAENNSKESAES